MMKETIRGDPVRKELLFELQAPGRYQPDKHVPVPVPVPFQMLIHLIKE